ncbi:MAG: PrsW family intramembrane metalloprotease [Haloarculaceae archaeon]
MASDGDPVARGTADDEDLYEIADWDRRSWLDGLAVRVHGGLRAARKWTLIVVATVLFVVQLAFAGLLVARRPQLGVLAVLSAVPAFALAAYVWYGDPTRRQPIETLAITFVLSVLFASIAALVNTVLNPLFSLIPVVGIVLYFYLVVAPIEETVKWLAIRTHAYNADTFGAVVDGAVYGAVAGLGFATIENTIYIAQGYMQASGVEGMSAIVGAVQTATSRAFVGPGHVLYSSFAGYYLGLAKFNPEDAGPIVVKGLLVAALIHATYNSLVSTLPFGAFPGPSILWGLGFIVGFDLLVAYALFRKLARYREHYQRTSAETADA